MKLIIARFWIIITMIFPSLMAHSQSLSILEECDTINIDERYYVKSGEIFSIDTNVHDTIIGDFKILNVRILDNECCLLYVAHIDTIYTIFDSVLINENQIYLEDTSYTTTVYNVWVENMNRLNDSLIKHVRCYHSHENTDDNHDKSFHLCISSFYDEFRLSYVGEEIKDDKTNSTIDCFQCHVIILHGKRRKIHDCPLYNNLYQLN